MKLIEVSTPKYPNTFTMVDDADFDWLNQWKWHAKTGHTTLYVSREFCEPGAGRCGRKQVKMHQLITGAPSVSVTDHIDGDGLNNCRSNLRVCTNTQNMGNRRKRSLSTSSRYKGVYLYRGRFKADISANKKRIHIGIFDNEIDAAEAYNAAALHHFGEFARLNVIAGASHG